LRVHKFGYILRIEKYSALLYKITNNDYTFYENKAISVKCIYMLLLKKLWAVLNTYLFDLFLKILRIFWIGKYFCLLLVLGKFGVDFSEC